MLDSCVLHEQCHPVEQKKLNRFRFIIYLLTLLNPNVYIYLYAVYILHCPVESVACSDFEVFTPDAFPDAT